jgi:hypothetical protein
MGCLNITPLEQSHTVRERERSDLVSLDKRLYMVRAHLVVALAYSSSLLLLRLFSNDGS